MCWPVSIVTLTTRVRLEKKPSRLRSTATRPGSAPVIRAANASMKAPRSPCALRIQAALRSKASDPSLNVLCPPSNAPRSRLRCLDNLPVAAGAGNGGRALETDRAPFDFAQGEDLMGLPPAVDAILIAPHPERSRRTQSRLAARSAPIPPPPSPPPPCASAAPACVRRRSRRGGGAA